MTRANIARRAFVTVLLLAAVAVGYRVLKHDVHPATATSPAIPPSTAPAAPKTQPAAQTHQGFLYGRITTADGATYQGLLRWGSDQEAFWSDSFSGVKHGNSWLPYVPPGRLPKERHPIRLLGIEIVQREKPIDVRRLLVARFGEIVRIEARGREVRVTLKSGTVVVLDRFEASDFDDGVRVWDAKRGVVDLDSLRIRTIEFLPTPPLGTAPYRLQGTVRTRRGDFTGFIQWDWEKCVGSDQLHGRAGMGKRSLRFDTLRSIARLSRASSRVTLLDGREMVLSGTADVSDGNRGIYVDDPRYGRVMVSWDAFERADFSPGASGPAYGDFPPGRPLTGSVTTRAGRHLAGRHLAGRLVYDLDESETTETLDASSQGVDYSIPFGLIASVVPSGREERGVQHGRVTLQSGEELQLERTGDLGKGNAGLLIFANGNQHPEYVRWTEVARVDLDRPPAMYPPLGGR